jgi:preprotein translocase subunit SecF
MLELIKKPNFDFLKYRKICFIVSSIMASLGIISIFAIIFGFANLGVDFLGGTLIQIRFQKPQNISKIRSTLIQSGFSMVTLQQSLEDKARFILRFPKDVIPPGAAARTIKKIFPNIEVERTDEVGPAIGKILRQKALWAISLAVIALGIYITLRFEYKFGIAAAITLAHDVLASLGFFFVLDLIGMVINWRHQIDLLTLTALMTLAGYSLNDTIVVFDRIRENIRGQYEMLSRPGKIEEIVNRSINEVLCRTVITVLTTLLVLIALLFFGSEVTADFCIILIFGIIVGTYSSIYIASPILVEWHQRVATSVVKEIPSKPTKKSGSIKPLVSNTQLIKPKSKERRR